MSEPACKFCGAPLPEGRQYIDFCSAAHYKRYGRSTNAAWAERDRQASRAWKARNREHQRAYHAAYEAAHKAACPKCGAPFPRQSAARGHGCQSCRDAETQERHDRIVAMYKAGESIRAIARALDSSPNAIQVTIVGLRKQGRVGYRYRAYERAAA